MSPSSFASNVADGRGCSVLDNLDTLLVPLVSMVDPLVMVGRVGLSLEFRFWRDGRGGGVLEVENEALSGRNVGPVLEDGWIASSC